MSSEQVEDAGRGGRSQDFRKAPTPAAGQTEEKRVPAHHAGVLAVRRLGASVLHPPVPPPRRGACNAPPVPAFPRRLLLALRKQRGSGGGALGLARYYHPCLPAGGAAEVNLPPAPLVLHRQP